MKRLFDVVCVFFASIVFMPFVVAVYVAIKLEDGDAISIFISNTKFVRILSAVSEELFSVLSENGWVD